LVELNLVANQKRAFARSTFSEQGFFIFETGAGFLWHPSVGPLWAISSTAFLRILYAAILYASREAIGAVNCSTFFRRVAAGLQFRKSTRNDSRISSKPTELSQRISHHARRSSS